MRLRESVFEDGEDRESGCDGSDVAVVITVARPCR